jgi:hypothetical protein
VVARATAFLLRRNLRGVTKQITAHRKIARQAGLGFDKERIFCNVPFGCKTTVDLALSGQVDPEDALRHGAALRLGAA